MNDRHSYRLPIIAVGDDLGIELPQAILDRYQLREGDDVILSWTAAGFYLRFTPPAADPTRAHSESSESP